MKKILITSFFVTILSLGCKKKTDQLTDFLNNTFPRLENGEILVIPNSGCSGCISDAENTVDSLIKRKNFKIIFTQIQSLKALTYRLKSKNINLADSNIFIDSKNLYLKNSEKYNKLWGFPTRILIENKEVVSIFKE